MPGAEIFGRCCRSHPDQFLPGLASLQKTDLDTVPTFAKEFCRGRSWSLIPQAKGTPSAHTVHPHPRRNPPPRPPAFAPDPPLPPSQGTLLSASTPGLLPGLPRRRGGRLAARAGEIEPGAGPRRREVEKRWWWWWWGVSQTSVSRGSPWDPLAPPRLRSRRQTSRRWLRSGTQARDSGSVECGPSPAPFLDLRPFPPSAPLDCLAPRQSALAETGPTASVSRSVNGTLWHGFLSLGFSLTQVLRSGTASVLPWAG